MTVRAKAAEPAEAAVPEARRVGAGGSGLHVLDWGGDGTPVVLLPGMGQSAHIYRALVPALGENIRAVAVTPRAHGESDTPETGYTLASFAADGVAVMDALGIGRAAVVGHSLGGAVATRLAADAPARVSHLVYLDSLTDYAGVGRIASRAPVRPPALPHGASDATERAWHRAFTYGLWNDAVEADWRARPDAATRRHRRELLIDLLDDAVHATEPFAALRCPALALLARESVATQFPWLKPDDARRAAAEAYLHDVRIPWRRASAERFRREARLGRVAEVPGNHFFFLSAPQRTAAEIRGFLLST
jgi:pimeloyl-ACP methyl ester carboxylesterase